jgi:murein L,D-transpeptidase YcbB/YkuD
MERWRWVPAELGTLYVQNNVPEFMLYVVKNGKALHADKIAVGTLRYATLQAQSEGCSGISGDALYSAGNAGSHLRC